MDDLSEERFETLAVGYGEKPRHRTDACGDVVAPVHLASTFALDELDLDRSLEDFEAAEGEYLYTRLANPTRRALEERLGALECGEHAFAFASGTAGVVSTALSTLEPGAHVVAFDDLYAGTKRLFERLLADRLGVEVTYVDATDPDAVPAATTDRTRLVWLESPTNPLMRLCDIGSIAEAVPKDVIVGVDNTFASPYFQRPLELGADVVVHSTTKYLNGHSDSLGGAVVTNDDALAEELAFTQQVGMGNVLAPFDAYLVLRGIKTLPMRMDRHEANATAIAEYLADHDRVRAVHYPGLETHPQHALAADQMDGFGGMLSFELDGTMAEAKAFLEALEEISLAVSLGGVESLIELPAAMTHAPLAEETRRAIGITDTLIRLSVGVEATADLVEDLERGFAAIGQKHGPAAAGE